MSRSTRRSLNDLYALGRVVRIVEERDDLGPDDEHAVEIVYVQKLDPLDHQEAVKKAKAARSRARVGLIDETSDDYHELLDLCYQATREDLINQIIEPEAQKAADSLRSEMELGEDSEWAKDGYMTGLFDAWRDRVEERYMADADDEEALRILGEFRRFEEDFQKRLDPVLEQLRGQYAELPDLLLHEKAMDSLIERRLAEVWMEEYIRAEVWLATRKACAECEAFVAAQEAGEQPSPHNRVHADYYFPNRIAVDRLDDRVRNTLEAAYLDVTVDPTEGKGSLGTGASSASSDQPAQEETEPSSGPVASPA